MMIKRIVPNVVSTDAALCREFYSDFLGLRVAMNMGWIATYISPDNPAAQLSVLRGESGDPTKPSVSIEVDDVDLVHRDAVARGYQVVYPLTNEPWGVRRFFVTDPNGIVINVMSHVKPTPG
jgi:catechol 2,3-dioxygenase-like lactoylglutathione lyase family enzyme